MKVIKSLGRRFRTARKVLAEDPSVKNICVIVWRNISRRFVVTQENWKPKKIIPTNSGKPLRDVPKIALTVHLFYPEYVTILEKSLGVFPFPCDLLITTPSAEIEALCKSAFSDTHRKVDIRRVPNRGRNIAPLLIEFGESLKNYDLVIHVHSKKSPHLEDDVAAVWSNELWSALLSDKQTVMRAMNIFTEDPKLGVFYPLNTMLPFAAFDWALTESFGRQWCKENKIRHISGSIAFPAGGMLWFKPTLVAPILDCKLSYSDFPEEAGQVDATLHHAIERLFGTVPLALGYKHLIYLVRTGEFTSDISFVTKKFSWRPLPRQTLEI